MYINTLSDKNKRMCIQTEFEGENVECNFVEAAMGFVGVYVNFLSNEKLKNILYEIVF